MAARQETAHFGLRSDRTPRSVEAAEDGAWPYRAKYAPERVIAAVVLVLLLPLLAACAGAVLVSVGWPAVLQQERLGAGGRRFKILKFRSMRREPGDDLAALPPGIAPGGPRSDCETWIGRLLRRTSLDELPQLVNVIRGEMSLVGPRPERPQYARAFLDEIAGYGNRLRVKPGMTGLAQVRGLRGQTSLTARIACDNFYIDNWSPWLDVKILLLTVRDVVRLAGE
jgi:lipopolysaccharide/colanic/teichoic acid biosynthesis glycosyltransferase